MMDRGLAISTTLLGRAKKQREAVRSRGRPLPEEIGRVKPNTGGTGESTERDLWLCGGGEWDRFGGGVGQDVQGGRRWWAGGWWALWAGAQGLCPGVRAPAGPLLPREKRLAGEASGKRHLAKIPFGGQGLMDTASDIIVRAHVTEAVSAGALFYATAATGQRFVGGVLRISSASWAAAPAAGLSTITAASCLSGHAAILVANAVATGLTGSRVHEGHDNSLQSTTAFATAGVLSFWLLGGRPVMVCPSDLRYLGAYARIGLKAGEEYAGEQMRGRIQVRQLPSPCGVV